MKSLIYEYFDSGQDKETATYNGYAFLIFELEGSVHMLLNSCSREGDKYFLAVSSPTMKCKSVQLRPWVLSDANFVVNPNLPLDARKTVFVGGVPRPLKACWG
uniref:RRM domain-containing protein n=1 Tax=Romanomermis culicivorax TaxID=13658 RepID=A0A915HEK1_ROMCU